MKYKQDMLSRENASVEIKTSSIPYLKLESPLFRVALKSKQGLGQGT